MTYSIQIESFGHDPHFTFSNEETFILDFLVILKHSLKNY